MRRVEEPRTERSARPERQLEEVHGGPRNRRIAESEPPGPLQQPQVRQRQELERRAERARLVCEPGRKGERCRVPARVHCIRRAKLQTASRPHLREQRAEMRFPFLQRRVRPGKPRLERQASALDRGKENGRRREREVEVRLDRPALVVRKAGPERIEPPPAVCAVAPVAGILSRVRGRAREDRGDEGTQRVEQAPPEARLVVEVETDLECGRRSYRAHCWRRL